MAKITFTFGSTLAGGNSRRKLIVYLHGQSAAQTVYSFDGRKHLTGGKNRLTDDETKFTVENAESFLKAVFEDRFAHLQVKHAYIADSFYNGHLGEIHTVFSNGHWTSREVANRRAYEAHKAATAAKLPTTYCFRLSVPFFPENGKPAVWRNFLSSAHHVGRALVDCIAQFRQFQERNPNKKAQDIAQIFGRANGNFAETDFKTAPRVGFLDTKTYTPRYHRGDGHRACAVIEEYAAIQKSNQEFEEMISNYTA